MLLPLIAGAAIIAAMWPVNPAVTRYTTDNTDNQQQPTKTGARQPRQWRTGNSVLVVGASQSGKTYWTNEQVRRFDRLLVWDTEGQFYDDGICTRVVRDIATLKKIVLSNPAKFKVSYQPRDKRKEFDAFCLLALVLCEAGVIGRCVETCVVVEELSDVTNPSKAPNGWGELVRKGLKRNMHL